MSMPWLEEDVVPTAEEEAWLHGAGSHEERVVSSVATSAVRIVDFSDFIATSEPSAEPLLGTSTNTLLPLGGTLLMYGDGGAGKTTLTIDAVSHLASGTPWLGIPVERSVKTLLIENEGPRGKFRQRLAEKHASWNGHRPFHPNVAVLEEPWTRFTLREPAHRDSLAATIDHLEVDLVVMGPLVTLGMVGGGTPDEVSAFEELLLEVRIRIGRTFSFWIIHHENKAGDISGAWDRVPDALCHVQALGNGHTRLVWQKARWADDYHKTTIDLVWSEGRSFTVRTAEERDLHADILDAFRADDQWRTVKEVSKLISARLDSVRDALSDLVARGEMAQQKGPEGRHATALCFRLEGDPALWDHLGSPRAAGAQEQVIPEYPPPRRGGTSGSRGSPEKLAGDPDSSEHPR